MAGGTPIEARWAAHIVSAWSGSAPCTGKGRLARPVSGAVKRCTSYAPATAGRSGAW